MLDVLNLDNEHNPIDHIKITKACASNVEPAK